jgi:hypothetical protein
MNLILSRSFRCIRRGRGLRVTKVQTGLFRDPPDHRRIPAPVCHEAAESRHTGMPGNIIDYASDQGIEPHVLRRYGRQRNQIDGICERSPLAPSSSTNKVMCPEDMARSTRAVE